MERPQISGWQITINENGVTMATLPAIEIRKLVRYAEWAESELQYLKSVRNKEIEKDYPQLQQANVIKSVCDVCNGDGIDDSSFYNPPCGRCKGTGKQPVL